MAKEADPENEDFIFERVKERYEFENERFLGVENKASNLIGWTGLFLSILMAGGSILFLRTDEQLKVSAADVYLLAGTLVLLLVSMGISLCAYRIGKYNVVPEPRPLINNYGNKSKKATLSAVVTEMAKAIEKNSLLINSKANWVSISWALFLAGMVVSTIFITQQASKLLT
jgi:hypothetical protein